MEKVCRDGKWIRLEERVLIEIIIIRTNGSKQLLKDDNIWHIILEDINSTKECNLSQVKKNGNK